jgi:hypothetical protein
LNTDIIKTKEIKQELASYLSSEIETSYSELAGIREKWDIWRRQREAEVQSASKNFPWKGASNVAAPLASTATKKIFAAMKAAFEPKKPFFHVGWFDLKFKPQAEVLEKYLNIITESKFHIDLRRINNEIFYELVSLGIQFVHVPWLIDTHIYKRKDPESGLVETVEVTRKDSPVVIPIPPEDVFYRGYTTSIQRTPWIGIRNRITKQELLQREHLGQYDDVQNVLDNPTKSIPDNLQKQDTRAGITAELEDHYEIFEIYMFWDVDDDGVMEDVKIWYEPKSQTILRAEYNSLGMRPISCFRYIPYTKKETSGIGIGKMVEKMQETTDALLNMGINSTHISSLQLFITPEDTGLGPIEEIYPLKQIAVPNPQDFRPITFPNTLLPNLQMIGAIQQWVDRDTGATNAMSGSPDNMAKTRATASGTMFLAQQGDKMFNAIIEGVEETFAEVGSFIFFQLALNKNRVDLKQLSEEEQRILKEVLDLPANQLPLRFSFSITTSEADQTEEAKRQKLLTMTQLYTVYGQQTMQLLMQYLQVMTQYQNQEATQMALGKIHEYTANFLNGSSKMMTEVLEEFGKPTDGFFPNMKDIAAMVEAINVQREQKYGGIRQQQNGGPIQQVQGNPPPGDSQGAGNMGGSGPETSDGQSDNGQT